MKRTLFLSLLLMLLSLPLLADAQADIDRATALIDGGSADRVHLRLLPSQDSESLGLYFEGTPVTYSGKLSDTWVWVSIGHEQGYMMTDFLSEHAADSPKLTLQQTGVIHTTSWVNLREAPTTECQTLKRLYDGNEVTLWGETASHWYFVSVGGLQGYVTAEFVETVQPTRPVTYFHQGFADATFPNTVSVLSGQEAFWHVGAREYMTLSQVSRVYDGESVAFPRYAVADVDQDGNNEIILSQNVGDNEYYGYLVLKSADGVVYGHEVYYRAMLSLKADGTFSFSSGAADSGFGYMSLSADGAALHELAASESSNGRIDFYLEGQPVSQAVYEAAVDLQEQKPEAVWYELTSESLEALWHILQQ